MGRSIARPLSLAASILLALLWSGDAILTVSVVTGANKGKYEILNVRQDPFHVSQFKKPRSLVAFGLPNQYVEFHDLYLTSLSQFSCIIASPASEIQSNFQKYSIADLPNPVQCHKQAGRVYAELLYAEVKLTDF